MDIMTIPYQYIIPYQCIISFFMDLMIMKKVYLKHKMLENSALHLSQPLHKRAAE